MEEIEDYKFGQVYDKKIDINDADKFANVFGEGSKTLTELIKYCILNNISTLASCKGHPEKCNVIEKMNEKGYITFKFNSEYYIDDFAYFLATLPLLNKGLISHIESNPEVDRTITLYVPANKKDKSEKYFDYILEMIKIYKEMKEEKHEIKINPEIRRMVDYMFDSLNQDDAFDITYYGYKKYERNGPYLNVVSKCPSSKEIANQKEEKKFNDFITASGKRY